MTKKSGDCELSLLCWTLKFQPKRELYACLQYWEKTRHYINEFKKISAVRMFKPKKRVNDVA